MTIFIEKIAQGRKYDPRLVVGYSDDELGKIERLDDIKLTGDFRRFMAKMGRSHGSFVVSPHPPPPGVLMMSRSSEIESGCRIKTNRRIR